MKDVISSLIETDSWGNLYSNPLLVAEVNLKQNMIKAEGALHRLFHVPNNEAVDQLIIRVKNYLEEQGELLNLVKDARRSG
jgi:hypothetical protein